MAYPYPGMPQTGGPRHQHPGHHPHGPPAHKEVEYLEVKVRYRDKDMVNTFKVHIFAEDMVLGNLHGEVYNLYPRAEMKRNEAAHCITVTRLGKHDHFFEVQLFRVLSRRGFALRTSHSTTLAVSSQENDIITTHVFSRG